eukprot:546903-Karenia_brevis.AAC.1
MTHKNSFDKYEEPLMKKSVVDGDGSGTFATASLPARGPLSDADEDGNGTFEYEEFRKMMTLVKTLMGETIVNGDGS